jgi:hypothetical protein
MNRKFWNNLKRNSGWIYGLDSSSWVLSQLCSLGSTVVKFRCPTSGSQFFKLISVYRLVKKDSALRSWCCGNLPHEWYSAHVRCYLTACWFHFHGNATVLYYATIPEPTVRYYATIPERSQLWKETAFTVGSALTLQLGAVTQRVENPRVEAG